MTDILLFDSDQVFGEELAQHLGKRKHTVMSYARRREALDALKKSIDDLKLVIVDMTRNTQEDWEMLDWISRLRLRCTPGPMILCLLKVYRGPRIELEIERRGGRVVYVR